MMDVTYRGMATFFNRQRPHDALGGLPTKVILY